jgi:hypothetical protein
MLRDKVQEARDKRQGAGEWSIQYTVFSIQGEGEKNGK